MKYFFLIRKLRDEEVYTAASIARWGMESGLVTTQDEERLATVQRRIRLALVRFSNNHRFPDEGDGMVALKGQPPVPGWFGWRWKQAAKQKGEKHDP